MILQTERFTSGKFWVLKVFLLAVFFSIFFSGGIDLNFVARGGYPKSYFQKIEHPLLDITKLYNLNSHDANTNFRLTVPVILHLLGIHSYWSLPLLTVAAVCGILFISCLAGYQLTGDRVCGCFLAMNVAATYVGSFAFIGYYDEIAICQLALAALPNLAWWARGVLVFTASFTDERAFVASSLLLVAFFFIYGSFNTWKARLRNPHFLAVLGGMVAYGIVRLVLMKVAGLSSPTGGNGPGTMVNETLYYLHTVVWFSLEGGWLLYALAIAILFARSEFLTATSLLVASMAVLGLALMVSDTLRSTVYIFPMLFISLLLVSRNETVSMVRVYCFLAFLISAVSGNYNVYLNKITWFEPLTIHWVQSFLQMLYLHFYNLLPHTMPMPKPPTE
jgi:hypothetical protein